ncbi:MAG: biotin synthase BioB [Deltaproteobacteria bacterium]|nr:biotin synthase BioB [Deltaproteobacteria bacterium]
MIKSGAIAINNEISDSGNGVSEIADFEKRILEGGEISEEEAIRLINLEGSEIFDLLHSASRIRGRFKGNKVNLCSIVNAKSGLCSEDCSFCAQSSHFETRAPVYDMIEPEKIVHAAKKAKEMKSREFSIVTSGMSVDNEEDLNTLCNSIEKIKNEGGLERCASLGNMSREAMERLKKAGLQSFHHNLETARSFFPNICTTHDYEDDVNTVRMAKELGFETCCGGILGLGETREQRVELALTLKELDVDSIPLNFLNPIEGTAMEGAPTVEPMEALKTIAVFRFLLPQKDIIVSGGREVTFRDLQSLIFMAGANGTLIGNYLTTKGSSPEKVLTMIRDLGLEPAGY